MPINCELDHNDHHNDMTYLPAGPVLETVKGKVVGAQELPGFLCYELS